MIIKFRGFIFNIVEKIVRRINFYKFVIVKCEEGLVNNSESFFVVGYISVCGLRKRVTSDLLNLILVFKNIRLV